MEKYCRIKHYPAASTINVSYVDYCDNDIRSTRSIRRLRRLLYFPKIKHVIFNGPATIVFWQDDTKTVVKCREGDTFDPEKGVAMAIAKKALGNEEGYYEGIKKWLPKEEISEKKEETSKKTCTNCKYTGLRFTAEPCFSCCTAACNGKGSKIKWESNEETLKWCSNCKYEDLSYDSEPCHTCIRDIMVTGRNLKWEPKEKPVEKTCEMCKYHNPTGHFRYGLACSLCRNQEYWEPKE